MIRKTLEKQLLDALDRDSIIETDKIMSAFINNRNEKIRFDIVAEKVKNCILAGKFKSVEIMISYLKKDPKRIAYLEVFNPNMMNSLALNAAHIKDQMNRRRVFNFIFDKLSFGREALYSNPLKNLIKNTYLTRKDIGLFRELLTKNCTNEGYNQAFNHCIYNKSDYMYTENILLALANSNYNYEAFFGRKEVTVDGHTLLSTDAHVHHFKTRLVDFKLKNKANIEIQNICESILMMPPQEITKIFLSSLGTIIISQNNKKYKTTLFGALQKIASGEKISINLKDNTKAISPIVKKINQVTVGPPAFNPKYNPYLKSGKINFGDKGVGF
jgi:hypothetical protein